MSLVTDIFFYDALKDIDEINELVNGRIFNTADDEVDDEEVDKTDIPYIMILNNGTHNDENSKDDGVESDYDKDSISLEIAANDRKELARLTQLVRDIIRDTANAFDDTDAVNFGFQLTDYNFSAGTVEYDAMKPCFWQTLNYECETKNL